MNDEKLSSLPESGSADRPNRGRARERVKRRQQERTTQARATGTQRVSRPVSSSVPQHIKIPKPSDNFKIPQLRLPVDRVILYVIGSVILVVLVVFVLGRIRNQPSGAHPNSLWVSNDRTYTAPSDEELVAFVERLRTHEIGTIYAWVTQLLPDGNWFGEANFPNVQSFVERLRTVYPEAEIFGWVNIPVGTAPGAYQLDQDAIQQAVADLSLRITGELGFDGVFLDVDPVADGDGSFLSLLRRVRAATGVDVPLAAAVPPDWTPTGIDVPLPPQIAPGTVWEESYKQSVALLVNQMVVRSYHTGFNDSADYSAWVAYQVQAFTDAVADLGAGTELFFGLPTYDADPPRFDPAVENVASAAAGVRQGVTAVEDNDVFVQGVAIYGDWTTDDNEWDAFRREWVER
jgi:hypothetical protein